MDFTADSPHLDEAIEHRPKVHREDGAREADDVVRHADVRRRHLDQQPLGVHLYNKQHEHIIVQETSEWGVGSRTGWTDWLVAKQQ